MPLFSLLWDVEYRSLSKRTVPGPSRFTYLMRTGEENDLLQIAKPKNYETRPLSPFRSR